MIKNWQKKIIFIILILFLIFLLTPWPAKAITILPDSDPSTWTLENLEDLINNIITLAVDIAGGIAVVVLIWAGFQYFTAFGNEEKANKAKTTITWAIAGIVFIILAKVLSDEIINIVH